MSVLIVLIGFALAIVGLISLIKPLQKLRIKNRAQGFAALSFGFLLFVIGVIMTPDSSTNPQPTKSSADVPSQEPSASLSQSRSQPATPETVVSQPTKQAPPLPAPPSKDEYNYSVRNTDTGTVYKGKVVSDVGFAILETKKLQSVGSNEFVRKTASPGAAFLRVRVFVSNKQKDAITIDANLFKLLANGREYSHSNEGSTVLMMEDMEGFFLKQINPDLNAVGYVIFEVPESLDLDSAQLQVRGGMTGRSATLPLKPIIE